METGDEILAEFVRGRGADAFGRLMQREMGFVYAAALRQCGNRELADDAAQAVFVLLWQKRETVKIGVPIKAWLFRATRYVVANARRAEARRAYREREAAAMRSEIAAAEGSGADAEMLGMLDDAMASLSEKDRQAVLLRYFEDQPAEAVGMRLGVTEAAAKKRVVRAVEKLRRFVGRRGVTVSSAAMPGVLAGQASLAPSAGLTESVLKLVAGGTSTSGSSAAMSLAKGAGQMMMRDKIKLVAIKLIAATMCVSAATAAAVKEATQTKDAAPRPAQVRVALAQPAASAPVESDDPEYDACRGVLLGIMDAYEHDDIDKLKSIYCADAQGAKTRDDLLTVSESDLAAYRLQKAAGAHFGGPASGLFLRVMTLQAMALDILSRTTAEDLQEKDGEITLTPSRALPGMWPSKPLYFREVNNEWKLDVGKTFSVSYVAKRIRDVAGETPDQGYAHMEHEVAMKYGAIATDIETGKLTTAVATQRRINQMFAEMRGEYSAQGCNVRPK